LRPRHIAELAKEETDMTTFVDSINGDFRPKTYFWAHDLKVKLPSDIAGAERRRLYEAAVAAGEPSPFLDDPDFSAEQLEPELRRAWGGYHPSHLGGEFLPRRRNEEVEIARIVIDSTTRDVTCVYAKRGKNRIYYTVVDEYGGDTLANAGTRTSKQPLTQDQLVDFFLGSWDLLNVLEVNFGHHGYPPGRVHGFLLDVQSDFYPDFEDEVRRRVDVWLAAERGQPVSPWNADDLDADDLDADEDDDDEDDDE